MRIGVMGDTHGDINAAREALRVMGEIDLLFHTGDNCADFQALRADVGQGYVVRGNGDRGETRSEVLLQLTGYTVWLLHGHKYAVKKGLRRLAMAAKKRRADIVVFGHTHVPICTRRDNILLFNPGSPSRPRSKQGRTCGLIILNAVEPSAVIISL